VKLGTNIILEEASPQLLHLLKLTINKVNVTTVGNSGLERHWATYITAMQILIVIKGQVVHLPSIKAYKGDRKYSSTQS
jgi:hypothetical protein